MKESQRNLTGFSVSPNPEVHDLENALGIKFTNPPARIELTPRNRLVFLARNRSLRGLKPMSSSEELGNFRSEYNAYFVRPGFHERITAWHENMHSYVDSVNPNESYNLSDLYKILMATSQGLPFAQEGVERIACVVSLDEGVSEWAAVQTALRLGTNEEKNQARKMNDTYTSRERTYGKKTFGEASVTVLEQSVATITDIIFSGINFRSPMALRKEYNKIYDIIYVVGYNYVNQAVNAIVSSGKSLAYAIDLLISNPPQTVYDIKNPKKFILHNERRQSRNSTRK